MSTNGDHPRPRVGLGAHSARGLVYLFASSTAAKIVAYISQLILLYLLGRADFGIVSLAYTITAFIQVIEQAGVGDVLVRRRRFRIWAVPGFWLALALGVFSCCLILLSAPIAAALNGKSQLARDELFWVLLVLAPSSLPNALSVIPRAQLARELRFRGLAAINLASMSAQKILTVLFAALGFGPFSFVLPTPITGALTAAFLWWWVRPPFAWRPQVRRWRYLFGDSVRLLFADFGRALLDQSDYILLGIFRTVELVGVYSVGFLFSLQTIQLLMINLTNILFPAFMRLNHEPKKQYQAFLKAQQILAMVGVSGCLLQAAAAEPFAKLVFPPKWDASIVVMQILSLGMATRMIGGASYALLKSQGRFNTIVINRWSSVVIQGVVLAGILAMGKGIEAVAVAVAIIGSAIGPITFYLAIRPYGGGWAQVGDILMRPIACGAVSVGAAWWIAQQMRLAGYGYFPQLVETIVVAVALNLALAWLWMRPTCNDLVRRLRQILPQPSVT